MSNNRQALLDSIHTGISLRDPWAGSSTTTNNQSQTGRPLSLMEQMRLAMARRGRNRTRGTYSSRLKNRYPENSPIWYYVSKSGTTQGPHTIKEMKRKYKKDINKNTFVWNGSTVNQWTQLSNNNLKDLLQQLGVSSTDCDYVWYCTKCNKAETDPHICTRPRIIRDDGTSYRGTCFGATMWKLRCLQCRKIADKDNICPDCNIRLQPETALVEAQTKEDTRQNKVFLQGCNNMNSNRDNMRLLVSGLVNELKDRQLYENFPIDINESVIMFSFNFQLMDQISDSLMTAKKRGPRERKQFVFSDSNRVVEVLDAKVSKIVIIEGKCLNKSLRKVWTVQILDHTPKTMIDLSIGIYNQEKWVKNSGTKHIVKIKRLNIGDVVSMLYLVDSSGDGALCFAVNGKRKDVEISEILDTKYKLIIVIKNPIKLKLI